MNLEDMIVSSSYCWYCSWEEAGSHHVSQEWDWSLLTLILILTLSVKEEKEIYIISDTDTNGFAAADWYFSQDAYLQII